MSNNVHFDAADVLLEANRDGELTGEEQGMVIPCYEGCGET